MSVILIPYLFGLWILVGVLWVIKCINGEARLFELRPRLMYRPLWMQCLLWMLWPITVPLWAFKKEFVYSWMRLRLLRRK